MELLQLILKNVLLAVNLLTAYCFVHPAIVNTKTKNFTLKSATAPTAPDIEGYKFDKWDKSFDNVTTDLVVTAQYKKAGGCGNSATILFTSLMILGLCLIRRKEF